jgi:hypothetical protein
MNSVLEKFRNSKLSLNHNFNLLRTSVKLFENNRGLGFDIITGVICKKDGGRNPVSRVGYKLSLLFIRGVCVMRA